MTPDFLEWFQSRFGAPFPIQTSARLEKRGDTFWATESVTSGPPMVPAFIEEVDHYTLAGEWGRGVNTYAFYFVEKRGPHRRFFRVFSGGAYAPPPEASRDVLSFLSAYEKWRAGHEANWAATTLIHNLDVTEAELTNFEGKTSSVAKADEGAAFWNNPELTVDSSANFMT